MITRVRHLVAKFGGDPTDPDPVQRSTREVW